MHRKDWAQILWKQIKCGAFVPNMERKVFSKWSLSHKMAFYVFGASERLVFRGAGHFVFSTECTRKESPPVQENVGTCLQIAWSLVGVGTLFIT